MGLHKCRNFLFESVEPFNCRLDCGSAFFFDFPRAIKCLFCNAADLVQKLTDLGFQAPSAILNAIENIVLYTRCLLPADAARILELRS